MCNAAIEGMQGSCRGADTADHAISGHLRGDGGGGRSIGLIPLDCYSCNCVLGLRVSL